METEEIYKKSLELHKFYKGKIQVVSKVPFSGHADLAYYYTPGVAAVSGRVREDVDAAYEYTNKGNLVAIVSDGTRVLGLGDIGPEAAMPVMEGKALLFKLFGGVDAFPICLNTKDPDKIIETIQLLSPTFGAINLEDIEKPKCFQISDALEKTLDIPYWHDDHHGTGLVVLAGFINALKVIGKKAEEVRVTVGGTGSAGLAIIRSLFLSGVRGKNIMVIDSKGIIYEGRKEGMDRWKEDIARKTNPDGRKGGLHEALEGADAFITATKTGPWIKKDAIERMSKGGIVFSMANPVPEILPDEAKAGGARIVATGRSDYPNQINNVLGFPGVFRGALDVRAKSINKEMVLAGSNALARLAEEKGLHEENIVPRATDPEVGPRVAAAVAMAAIKSGVAGKKLSEEEVLRGTRERIAQHMRLVEIIADKGP